jgi:hypothetical protein
MLRPFAAILVLAALTACAKPAAVVPPEPPAPPTPPVVMETPPPAPAAVTDTASVASVQRMLAQLGYDVGKPDGIAGAATRRTLMAFQRDHALAQDGLITAGLIEKLKALQAAQMRSAAINLSAGDTLIYSDSSVERVAADRAVQWDQAFGKNALVAVRPATSGWPPAARAGLDWAISHALDQSSNAPTQWSSTGVEQRFEIRTFALNAREVALAGKEACRRFELRGVQRRYPAIACRGGAGDWTIARSKVTLARPAAELGRAMAQPAKPQRN